MLIYANLCKLDKLMEVLNQLRQRPYNETPINKHIICICEKVCRNVQSCVEMTHFLECLCVEVSLLCRNGTVSKLHCVEMTGIQTVRPRAYCPLPFHRFNNGDLLLCMIYIPPLNSGLYRQ